MLWRGLGGGLEGAWRAQPLLAAIRRKVSEGGGGGGGVGSPPLTCENMFGRANSVLARPYYAKKYCVNEQFRFRLLSW